MKCRIANLPFDRLVLSYIRHTSNNATTGFIQLLEIKENYEMFIQSGIFKILLKIRGNEKIWKKSGNFVCIVFIFHVFIFRLTNCEGAQCVC